ncbi:MAG: transposase [Candidatus Niyogibacteria bacterium]|nr:transposase [Candidatus Niyogibacteria bacterium]
MDPQPAPINHHPFIDPVDPFEYDAAFHKLYMFFRDRCGLTHAEVQHRLHELSPCENPWTMALHFYAAQIWALPQTGQMQLEIELLTRPNTNGFFCKTTSYREELHPILGRHNLIFPMVEFETHGDLDILIQLERELLQFLGFGPAESFPVIEYDVAAGMFGVSEIEAEQERLLCEKYGPVVFLRHFPEHTSPFWNMKRTGNYARKVDVLLYGIETIGSAERSCDPADMRHRFHTITNGDYAANLFLRLGKPRVEQALEGFLALPMITRCGGGIGMTRMIRALKLQGTLFT